MVDATKIFPVDIRIIKTLRSDRWELTSRVEETWANGIFEWVSCISLKPVEKFSSRTIKVGGNHVLEPASKLVRYSGHWRLLRSDKVLGRIFIQLGGLFIILLVKTKRIPSSEQSHSNSKCSCQKYAFSKPISYLQRYPLWKTCLKHKAFSVSLYIRPTLFKPSREIKRKDKTAILPCDGAG